ncbi:MAG: hypothetical protein WC878_03690 [Candidatus Paceibacterota bacterium]|jgi:hypothetical protein
MNDLYTRYSRSGFSHLEYRDTGRVWGWFTPECVPIASLFAVYEESGLIFAVPYVTFYNEQIYVYADAYCVGQKTAAGKISEAYKWEERMAHHGFTPELIKKIKDFLERENK